MSGTPGARRARGERRPAYSLDDVAPVALSRKQLRQLVLDLREVDRPPSKTFGELAASWLRRIRKQRVCPENEERHVRHLAPLAQLREGKLTKAAIEDVFGELLKPAGSLGPAAVNKLRSTGRLVIRDAQGNGQWTGLNPFDLVRRLKEPRAGFTMLSPAELVRVFRVLREDRRRLARVAVFIGPRPGELLGLKKEDVDLERRIIRIRRSHRRPTTKTGRPREFPIPDAILEDLREAMALSKSDLVFPKGCGSQQRKDTKLSKVLRAAMRRAGLVTGFRHFCRGRPAGCGYKDVRPKKEVAPCPKCGWRLGVMGIPKACRFYDLRHIAATLHRKAGCDPLVISLVLGHAVPNVTDRVYTHVDEEYMRAELNKLTLPEELG